MLVVGVGVGVGVTALGAGVPPPQETSMAVQARAKLNLEDRALIEFCMMLPVWYAACCPARLGGSLILHAKAGNRTLAHGQTVLHMR